MKLARKNDYQAVLPVRGKIINALKNALDEVLENQEVQDIAKALGCGVPVGLTSAQGASVPVTFPSNAP